MRRAVLFLLVLSAVVPCRAQSAPTPQTARQALIEMFFSKTPGTFVKHLPELTRTELEKAGALTTLQQYSLMASHMQTQDVKLETFETGPVLLSSENLKTLETLEVRVEKEATRNGQDEFDVSFHVIKNGKEQPAPVKALFTFALKQETEVWRLNEIAFTVRIPLADPDLLQSITEKMKPQVRPQITLTSQSSPAAPVSNDPQVLAAMRTILTAEMTYTAAYPFTGFTCTLSNLDGFGNGEPNEHQAMLISSGLASGKKYGYTFTLEGCSSSPATKFRLIAAPTGSAFGRKAFCSDQSGVVKSSSDGNPETCFASGTPVQ